MVSKGRYLYLILLLILEVSHGIINDSEKENKHDLVGK